MNKEKILENERANFRNLFRQTPEMVCILYGPEHRFEFVNEAHVRALGFDATGMTVKEAQPESIEVHAILDEVYRTGKTAELHEYPVTVTDHLRYFNVTYAARKDEYGVINGIMVLGIEVTKEVLLRNQERESQEQLKFALVCGNMGAWIVDLITNKVIMSEAAYEIFGFSREYENPDVAIDTFIHPEDREHAREVYLEATTNNIPYADEYRIVHADGEIRWAKLRGRAEFIDGKAVKLFGVVIDVTEDKHTHEALENAIKIRDEFITLASHELRTPITSMQLQNQLLERFITRSPDSMVPYSQVKKSTELFQRKINQISHLIEDMLDVSKITTGKLQLNLASVNLNDLVKEVITRFDDELTNRKIQLTFEESQSTTINADSFRLDQVITNLLSNAIKYGEGKPIIIKIFQEDKMGCFSVKDFGVGIAEENHEKIFERFVRIKSDDYLGGLGLGLYISKQIVQFHDGVIELESKLGQGARFTVKIPLVNI